MAKTPWKSASLALLLALLLAGCGNGDDAPDAEVPAEAPVEDAPVDEDPVEAEEALPPEEEAPAEPPEEVEADTETLGESPAATLEEGAALPGETTRDEIDALIEEQERRFDEAQRRIDEQFEEAEGEAALPEPMTDEEEFESAIDIDSSLDDDALGNGPTSSDIDAIIEEQERRFEEAQRRLEEQFEAMESEAPAFEPMEGDDEEFEFEPME